ncbi:conserved hypothetical protein [Gammaproteobacteria bacterium]
MAKINEKIDDLIGASKRVNADKTGPQREIGPGQTKSKGIRTVLPSSLKSVADMMAGEDERLMNRRKAMDKNIKPDFSNKANSPDQKELQDLYETGISDRDIASAKEKSMKKGGAVKKMATGGKVSQLAKANGIAVRGKSRGKIC